VSDKELAAEVAALREEVRHLREAVLAAQGQQYHYHFPAYVPQAIPWQPQPYVQWWSNVGGAPPVSTTCVVNTTCAIPAMIPAGDYIPSAAGCAGAGSQVYNLQIPAS
jgi:hypothetical protein